jgi:signal transduction histidine kinase/CheY-like chemotaxis protein
MLAKWAKGGVMHRSESSPDDARPAAGLPRRLALAHLGVLVLTAVVCLSIYPAPTVALWSLAIAAAVLIEAAAASFAVRRPTRLARLVCVTATFILSALYSYVALRLIGPQSGGGRLFAFVLLSSSMIFALLRYYERGWAFVAAIFPQIAFLSLIGAITAAPAIVRGDYLEALIPVATSVLLILMFWMARAELAVAWQIIRARERSAEAASRAKSAFLATMSHEIRTPLNGVLGMTQAMETGPLDVTQRERLGVIRQSGETLLAILDDVLDLSKIDGGQLDLEISEFQLEDLIRGASATFAPLAARSGVDFSVNLEKSAHGMWRGDGARIRQIIYNLLSNAVKFTPEGRIDFTITRTADGVRLSVTDTGVGIAPDEVDRLFDRFVQGDDSLTRAHGGAGLGLTICRELTRAMGGEISVESEEGLGSTFSVDLPLEAVDKQTATPAPKAAPAPAAHAEIRVLAAEDNKVNQMVLKTLLAQAGVEPVVVENGARALEAWETGHWDLVLMDIQMPEMDGVAATRAIRSREAETGRRRTPIIAVTANAMVHQVSEYSAAGMDALVAKPIEAAKLFAAMEAALDAEAPNAAVA